MQKIPKISKKYRKIIDSEKNLKKSHKVPQQSLNNPKMPKIQKIPTRKLGPKYNTQYITKKLPKIPKNAKKVPKNV